MATKTKKKAARSAAAKASDTAPRDAIALLETDHRQVEGYFEAYKFAKSGDEKKQIAGKICVALRAHAQIEEELFYPPSREKTGDGDLIDEALVEHTGAKILIAQIEAMRPGQPLYDAKVKVLSEQIRHHVEEEESELFPEARDAGMDLAAIGAALAARKAELLALLAPVAAA